MMVCGEKKNVKTARRKPLIIRMSAMLLLGVVASPANAISKSLLPACPTTPVASWNDCQGTYTYPDGGKYVGEFHDGAPNGQGALKYRYWGEYVGAFRNSRPEGEGAFTYPDGRKYTGRWRAGESHGHGALTFTDGHEQTGEWREGRFTPTQDNFPLLISAVSLAIAVTVCAAFLAIAKTRTPTTPKNIASKSDADLSSQPGLDATFRLLEDAVEDFSVSDKKMLELRENARRQFAAQKAARKGLLGFLKLR